MDQLDQFPRLKTLYAVLAGIPPQQIYLDQFYTAQFEQTGPAFKQQFLEQASRGPTCGTMACAGGWAAVYPEFQKDGLHVDNTGTIHYDGSISFFALEAFFGISLSEAYNIFDAKIESDYTRGLSLRRASHQRVALHRIRLFLLEQKAITPARSRELAKFEQVLEGKFFESIMKE